MRIQVIDSRIEILAGIFNKKHFTSVTPVICLITPLICLVSPVIYHYHQ